MCGSFGDLYFDLNRHHTLSTNTGDARVALASDFKGKIHSQQNKQKSGAAVCVLRLPGKPLYSAVPKEKHHVFKCEPVPGGSTKTYELYIYKKKNTYDVI